MDGLDGFYCAELPRSASRRLLAAWGAEADPRDAGSGRISCCLKFPLGFSCLAGG